MKKYTLTNKQRARMARKAKQLLGFAESQAGCIAEELGTPVAESMTEGALENASEALALLAKIKCSLRVDRVARDEQIAALELSKSQIGALMAVRTGADIYSPGLARQLRELSELRPALVATEPAPTDSSGAKPYFGAIITAAGKAVLARAMEGGAK